MLFRLAVGWVGIRRLQADAEPVDATFRWLPSEISARLQLRRNFEMLGSADATMPMTWGILQPKILLPAEAAEWPETPRRAVILHELAQMRGGLSVEARQAVSLTEFTEWL